MTTATFEKTVDVLVKAYLHGDLEHQNCACCAVGNIIADSCGYKIDKMNERPYWIDQKGKAITPYWTNAFGTRVEEHGKNFFRRKKITIEDNWFSPEHVDKWIRKWVKSSGYSLIELAKIEKAFESAPYGETDDTWMFNGLMAVVDQLAIIHEVDLSVKESAKLLFVKQTV